MALIANCVHKAYVKSKTNSYPPIQPSYSYMQRYARPLKCVTNVPTSISSQFVPDVFGGQLQWYPPGITFC